MATTLYTAGPAAGSGSYMMEEICGSLQQRYTDEEACECADEEAGVSTEYEEQLLVRDEWLVGRSLWWSGGRETRRRTHGWRSASAGLIRASEFHSRQQRMKSMKNGSSQLFSASLSWREPGGPRSLPRREVPPPSVIEPSAMVTASQYRGSPFELMKCFERLPAPTTFLGGMPSNSTMHANWSLSSSPGSSGSPVNSSHRMQPRLHMSMAVS